MATDSKTKKRLVVSFHNLSPEMQEEVKKKYPTGFADHMIRIDKGAGEFFYAVVFETDDTNYLVKIDVKVDDSLEEEEDKEYYDDEIKGADEIIDSSEEKYDEDE